MDRTKESGESADVLIPSLSRVVERRRVCVVELAIGPFSILVFHTLCLFNNKHNVYNTRIEKWPP